MIAYLSGKIVAYTYETVIISVKGLGYEINYFNDFSSSDLSTKRSFFISHKISEYGQTLYGFDTFDERQLFEVLTTIKGVGAKVIFKILSSLTIKNIETLRNIKLDDLVKVDGVGKSIAQKFLLGLSSKLKKELSMDELTNETAITKEMPEYEDIFRSLAEWGIAKKDMQKIVTRYKDELEGKPQEYIVRFILKEINIR